MVALDQSQLPVRGGACRRSRGQGQLDRPLACQMTNVRRGTLRKIQKFVPWKFTQEKRRREEGATGKERQPRHRSSSVRLSSSCLRADEDRLSAFCLWPVNNLTCTLLAV